MKLEKKDLWEGVEDVIDMEGWPEYWPGLPPMHYATHCVGPVLGIAKKDAVSVSCVGSGRISPELQEHYGSPFAIETCHIKMADSNVIRHVYRSLFDTARQYRESFEVYGSKKSVEWPLIERICHHLRDAQRPLRQSSHASQLVSVDRT